MRHSRGLHYLPALLAAPGRDIAASDLVSGGAGISSSPAGPTLDRSALAAYRRRLDELDAMSGQADRSGDVALGKRAEAEREALRTELRHATGLGRWPRTASPEAERARVNVTRTLRATLDRIAENAPKAGAHLHASIRTGGTCRYQPTAGGPARWTFEPIRQSIGVELLPEPQRTSILAGQRIEQDLILGYWDEMLSLTPDEMQAWIDRVAKTISVPVLAVFGQTIDATTREHLLGHIPSVEIEEWAGLGHMVHLMAPQQFARRVAEFADKCFAPKA